MTRINAGIPPSKLTNKHLIAEHREIKRIPNQVTKTGYVPSRVPLSFRLGKGHVMFFYNKQKYLYERYNEIYQECIRRGFKVCYYGDAWNHFRGSEHWKDFFPSADVSLEVSMRINERLKLNPYSGVLDWHTLIDKQKSKTLTEEQLNLFGS